MSTIGFLGLGKLGLPCALAIETKGHKVIGHDPSVVVQHSVINHKVLYEEAGAQEALVHSNIELVSVRDLAIQSDIVFVAVQTPHDPSFEGTRPMTDERRDFDYSYLASALSTLFEEIARQDKSPVVVIISTVLPGTIHRTIEPLVRKHKLYDLPLCYNPFFIAMGTAMRDFLEPEFVLLGGSNDRAFDVVESFYSTIHDKPVFSTSIENAELIKVLYNTYIGTKIAFANTIMEICHKTPNTNCDNVVDALSLATERLISSKYMRGGMGDGGGCHPRDNIALSWLSRELKLSHDMFQDIMLTREDQTKWLADLIITEHRRTGFPIRLMGAAFKANTNISTGSPALLLSGYLNERGYYYELDDPHMWQDQALPLLEPRVYFISTKHDCWEEYDFYPGSVVIDPWRYLRALPSNVKYIPVGVGLSSNAEES